MKNIETVSDRTPQSPYRGRSERRVGCHRLRFRLRPKKTLHPSLRITGREILVSSRLVPRMESAVNMNEQTHDNMSASHGRCENGKENEKT